MLGTTYIQGDKCICVVMGLNMQVELTYFMYYLFYVFNFYVHLLVISFAYYISYLLYAFTWCISLLATSFYLSYTITYVMSYLFHALFSYTTWACMVIVCPRVTYLLGLCWGIWVRIALGFEFPILTCLYAFFLGRFHVFVSFYLILWIFLLGCCWKILYH